MGNSQEKEQRQYEALNELNKRARLNLEKENKKSNEKIKALTEELNKIKEKQKREYLCDDQHIRRTNSTEEETNLLLTSKLKALKAQFLDIQEDLDNLKQINEIEKLNNISEKMINNKGIDIDKTKTYCGCKADTYLIFNFKFIGILFVTLNLIGVYQLISVLKSTKEEMVFGVKSFIFAKNRTDYFPENNDYKYNYESNIFNNLPDFNLLYLTSVIGNFVLKGAGYRLSSIIYILINAGFLFIVRTFEFPDSYDFYQLILIIIYYLLLLLSIGSVTLFSQQIYFDGLTKYYSQEKEYKKENEEKIKNNIYNNIENRSNSYSNKIGNISNIINEEEIIKRNDSNKEENLIIKDRSPSQKIINNNEKPSFFFYLCFTQIPAYSINLGINYLIKELDLYNKIGLDIFLVTIIIYGVFTIFSILIYWLIYSKVFVYYQNEEQKDQKKTIRVYRIFGYIIYCEKKEQGLKKNNQNENNLNQALIKNEKSAKDNENKIEYLKNQKDICCYSCKLGAKKFLEKSQNTILPILCCYECFDCCCKCCFKCCCCYNEEEELSEIYQGRERFCYCYKVQRKISWFCDLLFRDDVLDLIYYDLINELLTIGYQKQMNRSLKENDKDNFVTLVFFMLYFFFFAGMNKIYDKCLCDNDKNESESEKKNENQNEKKENNKNKRKNEGEKNNKIGDDNKNEEIDEGENRKILKEYLKQKEGIIYLTITNFFFVTIFSGFSIFGRKGLQNFTTKYLISLPLALTKFYIFLLMNCLLNIIDSGKNIDLLSNSTIISIFLFLYSLISSLFTDILDIEEKALIIFQFVIGMIFFAVIFLALFIEFFVLILECLRCLVVCICCCCYLCSLRYKNKN